MRTSLLARQVKSLTQLVEMLNLGGVSLTINAVIGDLDEDAYIWPSLGRPPTMDELRLDVRRLELRDSAQEYCQLKLFSQLSSSSQAKYSIQVVGLSRLPCSIESEAIFEDVVGKVESYFDREEFEAEIARMRELWDANGYYSELQQPSETQLREIVNRKFAAYAQQGVQLYQRDPNTILIQTERPAILRTKMLNVGRGILNLQPLPAIYSSF